MTDSITIAQIPSGQSLHLVSAVGGLLDAALGGAMMKSGNGYDVAATITTRDGQTEKQVLKRLRAAVAAISRKKLPDFADDEPTLTLNQLSDTDDGMAFGIGDPDGAARETAKRLIATFKPALDHHHAVNYIEYPATDPATGERYALIIVRPDGLTPHEARQKAEAETARLRALLAEHGIEDGAQ